MLTMNQAYEKLTAEGWELAEGSQTCWVHPEIEGWIDQRGLHLETFVFTPNKVGYKGEHMTAWFYAIENILNYAKSL